MPAPGQWDSLPAAVADLRQQGLSLVEIAARLGVKIHEVKEADRARRQPDHGTLERWRAGCRCDACSEAAQRDPLTLQVAELRAKGKSIASIAGELAISRSKAARAALAVGPTGRHKVHPHGSQARRNEGCRCAICMEAIRNDPFVAEVGRLRSTGLNYKEIAERLEVPYWRVASAGRQAEALLLPVVQAADDAHEATETGSGPSAEYDRSTEYALGLVRSPGRVKTPEKDPFHGMGQEEWEKLVAAAGDLRRAGLSYRNIRERLGVSDQTVLDACTEAGVAGPLERPLRHGTMARLITGCECPVCTEARDTDPTIAAAAELKQRGVPYRKIGELLGITENRARHAVIAAGFSPEPEDPEQHRREARVAALKLMRDRGLAYSQIREALGISESTALKIAHELGFRGQPPVKRRVMTGEEEKRAAAVRRLRTRGLPYREIGEQLGIAEKTARKIAHELGLHGRPERPTTTRREKRAVAVRRLRTRGLSYREIGERLGISERTAQTIGLELGFHGRPERPAK